MVDVIDKVRALTGRKRDQDQCPAETQDDASAAVPADGPEPNYALDDLSDRSGLTIGEQRAFEYMDAKLREMTRKKAS